MAYVSAERAYYDADSHIMELPNFLKAYADPELRDDIPEVSYSVSVVTNEEVEVIMGQGVRHSEEHVAAQLAMGDALIQNSKEIQALGAFNGEHRSAAMDLLGFKKNSWCSLRIRWPFPFPLVARKIRCSAMGRLALTIVTCLIFAPTTVV